MQILSNTLIKLRKERGWSQEQLARISGLSERTIQRIESSANASLDSIMALACAFDISPKELQDDRPLTEQALEPNLDWSCLIAFILYGVFTPIVVYAFTTTNAAWELACMCILYSLVCLFSVSTYGYTASYRLMIAYTPWLSLSKQKLTMSDCQSFILQCRLIIQSAYIIALVMSLVYLLVCLLHLPEKLQDVSLFIVELSKPVLFAVLMVECGFRPIKQRLERVLYLHKNL